jgi:hypothetical protein
LPVGTLLTRPSSVNVDPVAHLVRHDERARLVGPARTAQSSHRRDHWHAGSGQVSHDLRTSVVTVPDTPPPARPTAAPRSTLVRVGLGLAVVGIVVVVAVYVDAAVSSSEPPLVLYLLSLLLPLGMVVAAVGVARDYRRPR